MLRQSLQRQSFWVFSLSWMALVCVAGCFEAPQVDLVSVFPQNSPHLLDQAGVRSLRVTAEPVGSQFAAVTKRFASADEIEFKHSELGTGTWRFVIQGLDGDGPQSHEVVSAQSEPFWLERGRSGEALVTYGRTFHFNLYSLRGDETAKEALRALVHHTATPFVDDSGKDMILVVGGRRDAASKPVAQAVLIDTSSLAATLIESSLSCARAEHYAVPFRGLDGVLRIAIAGGESLCDQSIDVFDTRTKSFASVRPANMHGPIRALFAEVTGEGSSSKQYSGSLLVLADRLYGFNPLRPEKVVPRPSSLDTIAGGEVLAAASQNNAIGAVGRDGRLAIDLAVQSRATNDTSYATAPLASAELGAYPPTLIYSFDDEMFLVFQSAGKGEAVGKWSLAKTDTFAVKEITSGTTPIAMPTDFAAVAARIGATSAVLFTGGYDAKNAGLRRTDSVQVFFPSRELSEGVVLPPLWLDGKALDSASHKVTLNLSAPRAGHAAATLGNGSIWLIGGTDDATVDVFMPGQGSAQMTAAVAEFRSRNPVVTSVVVYDSHQENEQFSFAFANKYMNRLFSTASESKAILAATASADRGILVGTDATSEKITSVRNVVPEVCAVWKQDVNNLFNGVVLYGDVPVPENMGNKWIQVQDSTEAAQISNNWVKDVFRPKIQSVNSTALPMPGVNLMPSPIFGDGTPDQPLPAQLASCPWQHLSRTGFAGLEELSLNIDPLKSKTGVKVLVIVASNDDCSQGFFGADGVALPDAQPDIFRNGTCDSQSLDDYLDLPLDPRNREELREELDSMVDNRQDLIVALAYVSHASSGECQAASQHRAWPRRLESFRRAMEDERFNVQSFNFCVDGKEDIESLQAGIDLDSLMARIEARNRVQACLPVTVRSNEKAPAPPLGTSDDEYLSQLALAELENSKCQVVTVVDDSGSPKDASLPSRFGVNVLNRGDGSWTVGADNDGLAGCGYPRTVQLSEAYSHQRPAAAVVACQVGIELPMAGQ